MGDLEGGPGVRERVTPPGMLPGVVPGPVHFPRPHPTPGPLSWQEKGQR